MNAGRLFALQHGRLAATYTRALRLQPRGHSNAIHTSVAVRMSDNKKGVQHLDNAELRGPKEAHVSGEKKTDDPNEEMRSLESVFEMIDSSASVTSASRTSSKDSSRSEDPMQEFERILADMAGSNTKAYKASKPAPLFWDEAEANKNQSSHGGFLEDLSPNTLFEDGHRVSAFSAGKLAGDSTQISSLAKRIQKLSKSAMYMQRKEDLYRKKKNMSEAATLDYEQEQLHLSALSFCNSVPKLSKFVLTSLLSRSSGKAQGMTGARPSPVVYAEVVRIARELKAPSIGIYLYNHCRGRMDLLDRLRVLNHAMYSELLTTAWRCKSDISLVLLIMQDIVAMGVVGQRDMERQIDQIIVELRKVYNMPNIADLVLSLKKKITFKSTSFSTK